MVPEGQNGTELLVALGRNLYISETVKVESIRFLIVTCEQF